MEEINESVDFDVSIPDDMDQLRSLFPNMKILNVKVESIWRSVSTVIPVL